MSTRQLLYSSVIYGAADVIVLVVGGFVLLPLYTRTLSQSEFGIYVIVKANAEIFTYLLYLGLPSAAARLYFDYRKSGQHVDYINSVVNFFALNLVIIGCVFALWGDRVWTALSPTVPSFPYLWFSVAIAAVGFFATLGSLWLRLERRAYAFACWQICTSVVLIVMAVINLALLHKGLPGLFFALLASSACSAAVLPWLFGRSFRFVIKLAYITESLKFAAPIVIGYLAYFVLNRINTLILQRHVQVDQIAIFGLAQQLAMMVTIVAVAFGKALQPAVFAAVPSEAPDLMKRSGNMLILIMFCITSAIVLFGSEIFSLVAPKNYGGGYRILLILSLSSFAYSFCVISDTALLYHRRPKTSVAVSIVGAVLSALLGFWWVPLYRLFGAAFAMAAAFFAMALLSHWMARKVTGHSYFGPMMLAVSTICILAFFADWLQRQGISTPTLIELKIAITVMLFTPIFLYLKKSAT